MTDLKKLRELAEKAIPVKAGICNECQFDFEGFRHRYGCSIPEDSFADAANPQAIIELLDRLERYEKALTYYAYEIVADSLNAGKTTITTATGRIAREALEGGK